MTEPESPPEAAPAARTAPSESEARLRDFVDAASDWLWEMDADLRFVFVSDRYEAVTGKRRAEVLGRRRSELTSEDTTTRRWREHLADLEARRPFRDFRYSVPRSDGTIVHWSVSGNPVFDDDGVFRGYRGVGRDRTAEVLLSQREDELREKSALLQAALDATDQGFAVFDAGLTLIAWNQRYLDLFGLPAERARGAPPAEEIFRYLAGAGIYGPGDIEAQVRERLRYLTNPSLPAARHLRLASGREIELARYDMPDGGRVVTFTDVTERLRAAEALRESTEQYQNILANMPGVVFRRVMREDGSTYIAFVSDRIRDVYGYDPEEYVSDPERWQEMVHPEDRESFAEEIARSARTLEPVDTEIRVFTAGGELRWHRSIFRPRQGASGETIWDGLAFDVTERKRAEQELARHRDRLEELVARRTRDLEAAQQDLVRSERLAAIGQLTATVGHELRNPLGTIMSSFYTVRSLVQGNDPRLERALARIERSIQRCDGIIEELLAFTRDQAPALEPVAIDEWIAETMEGEVVPDGVTMTVRGGAGVTVEIDRERMRQAVTNVVHNAWQAVLDREHDRDRREVALTTAVAGARVEVRVADSGPGIPAEYREKIFEPLFSTKSFGVGLGLPLVKRILEQHAGGVAVESEPGRDTVVTLWLPLRRDHDEGYE